MKEPVIILGSGGHAGCVIDFLQLMGTYEIIGVTTTSQLPGTFFNGYPILGNDDVLNDYKMKGVEKVAIGVGGFRDNKLRKEIFEKVKTLGFSVISAIHPHSCISGSVRLGEGLTIFPGTVINKAIIGNNVIVGTGSTIDHETIIEDHILVSAGVTVGAYCHVKEGTLLALGSKVASGIVIGKNVLVAAGAVVVRNIPDNKTVYGIPAKEKE